MRRLTLGALLWLLTSLSAFAGVTCSVPYNLQNGTTADATQVMANYNALVTCFTSSAAAGANNDITSLSGLTTPIGPSVGGSTQFIGGTSTGTANAQVVATTAPTGFSLTRGYAVIFTAGTTNTGATQLNVNSQGLTNVYKMTAAGPGALTGGEIVAGQTIVAYYDGTQFEIQPITVNPVLGFGGCSNVSVTASVASSVLTVTFNGNNGSTPSATNPISCSFRDATIANGDPVFASATAALSINTNAAGATLGSTNGVPFRFWIVMFNNAGTLVPGLINCSTPTQIYPLVESNVASSTAISAAATAAGTFYTPNGTTVTNVAFSIVAYLEYSSGLSTAGTYASVPTTVQLFGPGVKKPGEVVQTIYNLATATSSVNSSSYVITSLTQAITPTSTVNLIRVDTQWNGLSGSTLNALCRLSRGTSPTLIGSVSTPFGIASSGDLGGSNSAVDAPGTASSVTYALYCSASANSWTFNYYTAAVITLAEIMG